MVLDLKLQREEGIGRVHLKALQQGYKELNQIWKNVVQNRIREKTTCMKW